MDLGESITFKCEAAGAPTLEYRWKFYGRLLGTKANTLTIDNVSKQMEGKYLCCVKNKFVVDPVESNTAELIIGRYADLQVFASCPINTPYIYILPSIVLPIHQVGFNCDNFPP